MNWIFETLASAVRGVVKLVLLVLAAAFALSVLCVGLLLVVVLVLRFLVTGRKPAVVTTFTRFNHAAQQFRPGFNSGVTGAVRKDHADIVDVEAHEVRSVLSAPAPSKTVD